MLELIRGSEGHTFNFGDLNIYAGPGLKGHKLPILAIRGRDDKKDQIVADFRNSTACAKFINDLKRVIDEANTVRIQAALPPLTAEQQAKVEAFGFDTPPTQEEMIERIQLLGQGKVTFVDEAVA